MSGVKIAQSRLLSVVSLPGEEVKEKREYQITKGRGGNAGTAASWLGEDDMCIIEMIMV